MFMSEDGSESGDTFFHEQLAKTISKVLEAVNAPATSQRDGGVEEFFCHEDAFLNPSARPEVPVKPAKHFAIVESSNGKDEDPDGAFPSTVCVCRAAFVVPALLISCQNVSSCCREKL